MKKLDGLFEVDVGDGKQNLVAEPIDKCPCGGEIAISYNPPSVLHAMPMCVEFEKREVLNYLQWVSGMRGIQ